MLVSHNIRDSGQMHVLFDIEVQYDGFQVVPSSRERVGRPRCKREALPHSLYILTRIHVKCANWDVNSVLDLIDDMPLAIQIFQKLTGEGNYRP